MTSQDHDKYRQIFEYLSSEQLPPTPEAAIVFGRQDERVARALGDLIIPSLVETVVITGGIGKDSGNLLDQGYDSEADYLNSMLAQDAAERTYTLPAVHLDKKASNGGENARNSMQILADTGNPLRSMTAVSHATSLRRLSETVKFETEKRAGTAPLMHTKASSYEFDAANPTDRSEAAAELLRLANWPAKGMLGEQTDIPVNLVDFLQDKSA